MSTIMVPLKSSAIKSAGFDGQNLDVIFHGSDKNFKHPRVPYYLFLGLITSDSPGTYYHENIFGKFK